MTSATELLPCPFCGGEAKTITTTQIRRPWSDVGLDAFGMTVVCKKCGATIPSRMAEDKAIAAWNTRAERTCHDVHEPPRNTTFWPAPHFKCSECGKAHVSTDYVFYCPNCGAKVVDE